MEKKQLTIVQKILALLNITEEGKIENFFMKQKKALDRDIKNLTKNLDTIKDQHQDELEQLNEKLEDAKTRVEEAYTSVKVEDIDTNEKASNFSEHYWDRIENAEYVVKSIEKEIESITKQKEKTIESIQLEIAERERRLKMIS